MLRFKAGAEFSRASRGVALLVLRKGEIIFEDDAPIWIADKLHLLAEGMTGFAAALAVCAAQAGLLDLDEKVSATITEWQDDPLKAAITIRQLLSLSTGIAGGDTRRQPPSFKESIEDAAKFITDAFDRLSIVGLFLCKLLGDHRNDANFFQDRATRTYLKGDGTPYA